jgi:hypothetical protein
MEPLVARLEKEAGVVVQKKETWHDAANEAERAVADQGRCGGVPFFHNTDTGAFLCGEASYDELKKWAGK